MYHLGTISEIENTPDFYRPFKMLDRVLKSTFKCRPLNPNYSYFNPQGTNRGLFATLGFCHVFCIYLCDINS